ncbi:MAG: multiheme c-type cytochrome [Planctomycetaceae bacterium]
MRTLLCLLAAAAALTLASAVARDRNGSRQATAPAPPRESCQGCHAERHPGLIAQWEGGAHAKAGVSCEECHGEDHDAIFTSKGSVPIGRCQDCHPKEAQEFRHSAHNRALPEALANARLLAQIPAMQRRGCLGCHDMGGDRGGRCNACHGAHRFSAEEARSPESCGSCHTGPDHPHIEAWEASRHGVAYRTSRDERIAPTCASCHMPAGTHDVSGGITIGRAGSGAVLEGETPPIPMKAISAARAEEERAVMLERCAACHTRRVAREALEDADEIKREADRLVGEAARIVRGLYEDRLLDPMPEERVAHPTAGHALVLGGPMLYENQSEAERIFFDLAKFAHAITFKGAYHLSPDHTHWLGIARLKASLEALRAEERRLRKR